MLFLIVLLITGKYLSAQVNCDSLAVKRKTILFNASELAVKKQFIVSEQNYLKADSITNANADCFTNLTTDYKDEYLKILPAAVYQKLLIKTIELQADGNFEEAIKEYINSGKYYSLYSIGETGLEHMDIVDFAFEKCSGAFLKFLTTKFEKKSEIETVLKIYTGLLSRNVEPEEIKRPLYDLGVKASERDRKSGTFKTVQDAVNHYTNGNPKLDYFKKGYLFGWKN